MSVDPREFRRTMGLFATGVTVVTTRVGDEVHGMTANSVTSVSLDPLLVLVCVDNRARMRELIAEAGRFAINILSERQQHLSGHFAGKPRQDVEIAFADTMGVPTLPGSLASLICAVDRIVDAGDHIVVFGRVEAIARYADDERPLVYYAGDYRRIATERDDDIYSVTHNLPYVS